MPFTSLYCAIPKNIPINKTHLHWFQVYGSLENFTTEKDVLESVEDRAIYENSNQNFMNAVLVLDYEVFSPTEIKVKGYRVKHLAQGTVYDKVQLKQPLSMQVKDERFVDKPTFLVVDLHVPLGVMQEQYLERYWHGAQVQPKIYHTMEEAEAAASANYKSHPPEGKQLARLVVKYVEQDPSCILIKSYKDVKNSQPKNIIVKDPLRVKIFDVSDLGEGHYRIFDDPKSEASTKLTPFFSKISTSGEAGMLVREEQKQPQGIKKAAAVNASPEKLMGDFNNLYSCVRYQRANSNWQEKLANNAPAVIAAMADQAKKGNVEFQYHLARWHALPLPAIRDDAECTMWTKMAALSGHASAKAYLAIYYAEGLKGCSENKLIAYQLLDEVEKSKNEAALETMAGLLQSRFQLRKDFEDYKKSLAQGANDASLKPEKLIEKFKELKFAVEGNQPGWQEKLKAEVYLIEAMRSAAENGNVECQFQLARWYAIRNSNANIKDDKACAKWTQLAANNGHTSAKVYLAVYCYGGLKGIQGNEEKAMQLLAEVEKSDNREAKSDMLLFLANSSGMAKAFDAYKSNLARVVAKKPVESKPVSKTLAQQIIEKLKVSHPGNEKQRQQIDALVTAFSKADMSQAEIYSTFLNFFSAESGDFFAKLDCVRIMMELFTSKTLQFNFVNQEFEKISNAYSKIGITDTYSQSAKINSGFQKTIEDTVIKPVSTFLSRQIELSPENQALVKKWQSLLMTASINSSIELIKQDPKNLQEISQNAVKLIKDYQVKFPNNTKEIQVLQTMQREIAAGGLPSENLRIAVAELAPPAVEQQQPRRSFFGFGGSKPAIKHKQPSPPKQRPAEVQPEMSVYSKYQRDGLKRTIREMYEETNRWLVANFSDDNGKVEQIITGINKLKVKIEKALEDDERSKKKLSHEDIQQLEQRLVALTPSFNLAKQEFNTWYDAVIKQPQLLVQQADEAKKIARDLHTEIDRLLNEEKYNALLDKAQLATLKQQAATVLSTDWDGKVLYGEAKQIQASVDKIKQDVDKKEQAWNARIELERKYIDDVKKELEEQGNPPAKAIYNLGLCTRTLDDLQNRPRSSMEKLNKLHQLIDLGVDKFKKPASVATQGIYGNSFPQVPKEEAKHSERRSISPSPVGDRE